MKLAQRLAGVRESVIRDMMRLAIQQKAINLSQGAPDFEPPPEMIAAAIAAMKNKRNQYSITWGMPELRQAIAAKMARRYGLDFDPDRHVTVTCGVTEAIASSIMSLAEPGDEVIIVEPFHEGFAAAVMFSGAAPRYVPLEPPDYALDLDRLRAAFNERTAAIIVNTPQNPSGRVFTRAELTGIAELCREFDVTAVTDEIYEHILYDGRSHTPLATLPGMAGRTITTGGFGKTYAATGWRLGYACALEPLSQGLRTIHDFTTICAPAPLQAAAVAALNLPESFYDSLQAAYAERRDLMMAILAETGFSARSPEGTYYVMADFSAWGFDGDDTAFAHWLLAEAKVATVPASCFYGTPDQGHNSIRFAFGKDLAVLKEAGERLRRRWQDVSA